MFTKILCGVDGSELAIAAARAADDLARRVGASLTLLHVCPLPRTDPPFPGAPTLPASALEQYARQMHQAVWERTLAALEEREGTRELLERTGDPVHVLPTIAQTQGFDLIVLGSRGVNPTRAAEMGSVAYSVVHSAHCPVLIVR